MSAWASARWPSSTTASCWRALARLSRAFTWASRLLECRACASPYDRSLHHEHGQPQALAEALEVERVRRGVEEVPAEQSREASGKQSRPEAAEPGGDHHGGEEH